MSDDHDDKARKPLSHYLYEVDSSDPDNELIDRSTLSPEEISQIGRVMRALSRLRDAEQSLSKASERYMELTGPDMRTLHFLMVAQNRGEIVTPGMLASHLKISAASTTKLLNRLEKGAHIVRNLHPTDRRAFALEVTPETRRAAMQTVGRVQSRRFHAAARLTREERDTVIRFLEDMTEEISLRHAPWAGN